MDKFETFLENTLSNLRESRNNLFAEHGMSEDEVYSNGEFDTLPIDILMKICYVDAYASILANYRQLR